MNLALPPDFDHVALIGSLLRALFVRRLGDRGRPDARRLLRLPFVAAALPRAAATDSGVRRARRHVQRGSAHARAAPRRH